MKDIRGQSKAETQYDRQANLQQCVIYGRWFCRRKENVCSRDCVAKQEETPGGPS